MRVRATLTIELPTPKAPGRTVPGKPAAARTDEARGDWWRRGPFAEPLKEL